MRGALSAPAAVAAALLLAATPAGAAKRKPAVVKPWATVNVCGGQPRPYDVGVRVFIPRRGNAAEWAHIRLEYLAPDGWKPVRNVPDPGWAKLGSGRRSVFGGTTFEMTPPDAGFRLVLRGVADLQWRTGRKVTARATVRTTAGHASTTDPALKQSQASCEIRG